MELYRFRRGALVKILVATPMPPETQPTNSVPLVTYGQLIGLAARHQVTLVTGAGPDSVDEAGLNRLANLGVDVRVAWRVPGAGLRRWRWRWRLVSTWLRRTYPFRSLWYWEPELQHLLDRTLQERFDVVTAEDNAMGMYRYHTASPKLLTEMEVRRPRAIDWAGRSKASWRQWAFQEADWRRWAPYQQAIWRQFDRIQVFTTRDAAAIGRIAPTLVGRVRVNPFGLDLPPAADPAREDNATIVFVGGFSHWPNVDAALWLAQEIMPRLRQRRPDLRLVLVGSYPPASVQALAAGDVTVTGYVPAVEPYLERAAVVLAPVRVGGGMRMKVLQAMALGKAVVTTPLGVEGLTTEGASPPLALAADADAVAAATADLLADVEKRHALGRSARAFVAQHYSTEAYTRRLEAIYNEVLAERRAA